MNMLC